MYNKAFLLSKINLQVLAVDLNIKGLDNTNDNLSTLETLLKVLQCKAHKLKRSAVKVLYNGHCKK